MSRRVLFAGQALLLVGLLLLSACAPPPPRVVELPPVTVTVSTPIQSKVSDFAVFTGRTEGSSDVDIRARVSGYLDAIKFSPGKDVKKGDLLFVIDKRPYQLALDQAVGNLEQLKAKQARLNADLDRAGRLRATRAMSQEEYDKILSDRNETQASIVASEALVKRAKLDMEFTEVRSPIDGWISRERISVGNLVQADQTILTNIVCYDPIYVNFDVDERTVLRVLELKRQGRFRSGSDENDRVPVSVSRLNDIGFPYIGYINFTDNRIDPATGTMRLRAEIANPRLPNNTIAFTAGMFVRVRVAVSDPHEELLVSELALVADQGVRYLYVVDDNNQVQRRDVTLGMQYGSLRVITKGLKPTDRVITDNLQRIRPGSKVDPKLQPMRGRESLEDVPAADPNKVDKAEQPADKK
jgi:multidrug efflux system membrane fusion protein